MDVIYLQALHEAALTGWPPKEKWLSILQDDRVFKSVLAAFWLTGDDMY